MRDDYTCCMDQDKDDNLWIGTRRGPTKFDGKSFTNYGAKDGFSDKNTWAILCDSKGYIWFGTKGGMDCFDLMGKSGSSLQRKRTDCIQTISLMDYSMKTGREIFGVGVPSRHKKHLWFANSCPLYY